MIISQVDYFLLLALGTHRRLRPNIRRFVTIWKLLLTEFLCPRHCVEKWPDVVPRNQENNIQFRWQVHGGTVELNPNSQWLLLKNFINIYVRLRFVVSYFPPHSCWHTQWLSSGVKSSRYRRYPPYISNLLFPSFRLPPLQTIHTEGNTGAITTEEAGVTALKILDECQRSWRIIGLTFFVVSR
jgi:hypothetical protein